MGQRASGLLPAACRNSLWPYWAKGAAAEALAAQISAPYPVRRGHIPQRKALQAKAGINLLPILPQGLAEGPRRAVPHPFSLWVRVEIDPPGHPAASPSPVFPVSIIQKNPAPNGTGKERKTALQKEGKRTQKFVASITIFGFQVRVDKPGALWYTKDAGRNTLYTHVTELVFKRTVSASAMREPPFEAAFYIYVGKFFMDLYVFSDESGVFDRVHNDIFVFGGIVFFSKEERDACARKYIHAERALRSAGVYSQKAELKASAISKKDKGKLFRATNQYCRFSVAIYQKRLLERIFADKKTKQRYLDYAYKIGLKRLFEHLIKNGTILPEEITNIFVFADQHTTATNGRYELEQSLQQEFKFGTYNQSWSVYYPPLFHQLQTISVSFCNSAKKPLIRAADIIANRVYYMACQKPDKLSECGVFLSKLP